VSDKFQYILVYVFPFVTPLHRVYMPAIYTSVQNQYRTHILTDNTEVYIFFHSKNLSDSFFIRKVGISSHCCNEQRKT